MPDIITNPVSDVYQTWSTAISTVVGENYSMERSQTIVAGKQKYARMFMLGNPTASSALGGDECATRISFQTESYATGIKALSTAYEIDAVSHASMVGMGFIRTYGPEVLENADGSIKRVVSRYGRAYTGQLLGE